MKARTLVALTILVAALAAFIFFFEKDLPSTEERIEQEKKVLVLDESDVQSVEISWKDEESGEKKVRLEKSVPPAKEKDEDGDEDGGSAAKPKGEWHLTEPLAARADESAVSGLLSSLGSLEKERTLEDVDRQDLGFDEPRGTVTLATDKGEKVLEIGPELPASSDMLVAVGGRAEVYQVSNSVWSDLTKAPGDWRAKELFTASRSDIERLTLAAGAQRVLLARRGDDFWIESPLTDLADQEEVNGLVSEVTGLRVESFVDDPEPQPAELGLEPPAKVLEVVLSGRQEPFRLEIGNVEDGGEGAAEEGSSPKAAYARCGEQIVRIKSRLVDSFARTPEDWRSRAWTPIQVYRVDSATFEDAEGSLEVTREEGNWRRGEDRVAYSAVSDVLYAVSEAKAEEVVSREEAAARGHSLDDSTLRVTLKTDDSSQSLALYPTVDGLAAATREGRDVVLLLSSKTVDELTSKLAELRKAEPLPAEDEKGEDEKAKDTD